MRLKRKRERQIVLEALYAWHMHPKDINELIADVGRLHNIYFEASPFIKKSLQNVINNTETLDELIERYLKNWEFKRVAPIDIALLRLALAEMLYFEDIPPEVSINEVIELSKKYSNHNAPKFINGILDSALRELTQAGKIKNKANASKDSKTKEE